MTCYINFNIANLTCVSMYHVYRPNSTNAHALFVEVVTLKYPDCNKPYYVQTDVCYYGMGGQLFQYDNDNNIAVTAFTSRILKGAEINYITTEKGCSVSYTIGNNSGFI